MTNYTHLTPEGFRRRIEAAPIAYLPLGTLEWHGEHLPLGSDGLQASAFMEELARRAGGIVLPMLFLGPDKKSSDYCGMDLFGVKDMDGGLPPKKLTKSAYWIPDDLYAEMIKNVLSQLKRAGFKIVVAHGHGPSTRYVKENAARLGKEFGLKIFTCHRDEETDGMGLQIDHAAANETSIMMHYYPELVHMENLDPDPDVWPCAVWGDDPRVHASAEKGKKIIQFQSGRMAAILKEALKT